MGATNASDAEAFIDHWTGVSGSERANYQLFVGALCALLDVPQPEPSREDTRDNACVFVASRHLRPWRRQHQRLPTAATRRLGRPLQGPRPMADRLPTIVETLEVIGRVRSSAGLLVSV